MVKRVTSSERITQKSTGIKTRQLEFISWAEENIPWFDYNRLVRDKIDEQMYLLLDKHPEIKQFLSENE